MASLANIQASYFLALQDLGNLIEQINQPPTTQVRDDAISNAIRWYSRLIPNIKVIETSPNTTGYYPVPADWAQSSRIVAIEFPRDQNPPAYYNPNNYRLQRNLTGQQFYINPNPNDIWRLTYTGEHLQDASTINSSHEQILGWMAAVFACEEFATRFSNAVGANVDSVNYKEKANQFSTRAKDLYAQLGRVMRASEWGQFYQNDLNALRFDRSWRT